MTEVYKTKIQSAVDRLHHSLPEDAKLPYPPDASLHNVQGITKASGLLTDAELSMTENYSASQLVGLIARGDLTSEEVTRAFLKRAGIAQQLVNCVTEFLGESAIQRAKELDELLTSTGKPIGPLHGLPISVKENINMKGRVTHASYVAMLENVPDEDALLLEILINAGAVPFVRTTLPQAVMALETESNIYGTTTNPYNRTLTPGGSSGGEAALLAMRASPMGIGSDIGGSIRNPACHCGLYGLKPTTGRIPSQTAGMHRGREEIRSTLGPLAHSRLDLQHFFKTVLEAKPWYTDPSLVNIPWTPSDLTKSSLCVAVMWDDGIVKPLPPVTRALKETVEAIKAAGIRVVDYHPLDHAKHWDILSACYFVDGGKDHKDAFHKGGEPVLPLTEWILSQPSIEERDQESLDGLLVQRNAYRWSQAAHWRDQEREHDTHIDVILCPATPGPAPKLGTSKYWHYTSIWNLLDYPAAVFPVTHVDIAKDFKDPEYEPLNEMDREMQDTYSPEQFKDAPVGLQLVGRRFEDEKVLKALEIIEMEAMNRLE